ncbi:isoamylase early set domain-containing protein [Vibrio ostreicida]|uniref:Isoamylase early set domain-containing protein n=1 Tax=Vibrio ostreicida TaxID=526588 RepID=A0ABT8BYV7_9VIBR|nr:isoamylase early set domain-containing protein [Vibrio ostreicida]MDN3612345.1 isoamylase early set domain-containing protein [Vibrio ostreicida]NPD08722.1 1,4-alpha-glucan branching protein [Vibrio ostreicida]
MINKRFFKTKNEVEVTFELPQDQVGHCVAIVADFLNWQPIQMEKVTKTKSFKFKTRLPKDGQFEFRYLVDNEKWVNDPNADRYQPNGYGSDNCLVSTYQ